MNVSETVSEMNKTIQERVVAVCGFLSIHTYYMSMSVKV